MRRSGWPREVTILTRVQEQTLNERECFDNPLFVCLQIKKKENTLYTSYN